jgi:hypothetical protein
MEQRYVVGGPMGAAAGGEKPRPVPYCLILVQWAISCIKSSLDHLAPMLRGKLRIFKTLS